MFLLHVTYKKDTHAVTAYPLGVVSLHVSEALAKSAGENCLNPALTTYATMVEKISIYKMDGYLPIAEAHIPPRVIWR